MARVVTCRWCQQVFVSFEDDDVDDTCLKCLEDEAEVAPQGVVEEEKS